MALFGENLNGAHHVFVCPDLLGHPEPCSALAGEHRVNRSIGPLSLGSKQIRYVLRATVNSPMFWGYALQTEQMNVRLLVKVTVGHCAGPYARKGTHT